MGQVDAKGSAVGPRKKWQITSSDSLSLSFTFSFFLPACPSWSGPGPAAPLRTSRRPRERGRRRAGCPPRGGASAFLGRAVAVAEAETIEATSSVAFRPRRRRQRRAAPLPSIDIAEGSTVVDRVQRRGSTVVDRVQRRGAVCLPPGRPGAPASSRFCLFRFFSPTEFVNSDNQIYS